MRWYQLDTKLFARCSWVVVEIELVVTELVVSCFLGTSEPHIWQDLLSVENDFPSQAHCLARWYGLRDFVVMAPASQSDSISTESRANILLSSISIALANTSW